MMLVRYGSCGDHGMVVDEESGQVRGINTRLLRPIHSHTTQEMSTSLYKYHMVLKHGEGWGVGWTCVYCDTHCLDVRGYSREILILNPTLPAPCVLGRSDG